MSMLIKKLLTISLRSAMIVTIALCFSACKKNSDLPELNITYNNVRYHHNRASTEGYYAQFYNDELKEYSDWYYNAVQYNHTMKMVSKIQYSSLHQK